MKIYFFLFYILIPALCEPHLLESATQLNQTIEGNIKINGINYKSHCECGQQYFQKPVAEMGIIGNAKCTNGQMNLVKSRDGDGLNRIIVKDIIGPVEDIQFIDVSLHHFSCMDGRNSHGHLSTPGGDFGEFLLALHVYEGVLGANHELLQDQVDQIFKNYLQTMQQKRFYMCTDQQALANLEKELGVRVNLDVIMNPGFNIRKGLMKLLLQAENQGDQHLKMMMKNPEYYSIRPQLIEMFITSFFKEVWSVSSLVKSKILIDAYAGKNLEQAFVEVRTPAKCQDSNMQPLINCKLSKDPSSQVYLNHIDGIQLKRLSLAKFFINTVNQNQQPIDAQVMHNRLNRHGLAFLEITGSFVAKYLPFYTLNLM